MKKIYVIEMRVKDKYVPTIGVGLTKTDARMELFKWKQRNPDDKFRIKKYIECMTKREIYEVIRKYLRASILEEGKTELNPCSAVGKGRGVTGKERRGHETI